MKLKIPGVVMFFGGLLLIVRIFPVVAAKPESVAFPPETTTDLVQLAAGAGLAWPIAHAIGLLAITCLMFGYWRHAQALFKAGFGKVGWAAAAAAGLALVAFGMALIIDGFFVYDAALASAVTPNDTSLLESVDARHAMALTFFTPGLFILFLAVGLISYPMLRGQMHSRWLGALGMMIAFVAVTIYLAGVAGPNWSNMQTGGLAIMAGFFWHILLGLAALLGGGIRNTGVEPDQTQAEPVQTAPRQRAER